MNRFKENSTVIGIGLISALAVGGYAVHGTAQRKASVIPAPAPLAALAEGTSLAGSFTESVVEPVIRTAEAAMPEPAAVRQARLERAEELRLAQEIQRLKARDPRQLVSVINDAVGQQQPEIPLTFLLSIAYNETHGKVLAVSPAGAAGLAQATPAAYLSEGFTGKVFITNHYLIGTRSYIMKKPLGDAMNIASLLIKKNTPAKRAEAKRLLASAKELQREGMEELHVLEPHAPELFAQRVKEADEYNTRSLAELERLINGNASKASLRSYHTRTQTRYRAMMKTQQASWSRYQKQLEGERDRLLRAKYGMAPDRVIKTRAYEAGEYLATELDARFSPTEMARFLSVHLATKQREAQAMGIPDDELERWTAALYNGGGVNIKRMRAGLLKSIRETQNYMVKIPAMRSSFDRLLEG